MLFLMVITDKQERYLADNHSLFEPYMQLNGQSFIETHSLASTLVEETSPVFRGKRAFLEKLVATTLAAGYILIENVPGLGKTALQNIVKYYVRF